MYLNNYILLALNLPIIIVFFSLTTFKPKSEFFRSFKIYFGILVLISSIGIVKGSIIGIHLGKDFQFIVEDFLKISTFIFFIGLPYFIIGLKIKYLNKLYYIFNFLGVLYTFLVSLSLFVVGNVEGTVSIYPGNLFGATTVNLTIISAWTFYSYALYKVTHRKIFLFWTFFCYIDVLWSLTKWNFLAMIGFPLLIIYVAYTNLHFSSRKKYLILILSLAFFIFFFANISIILNPFAVLQGYESFDVFLAMRVLGDSQNISNLASTISFSDQQGIKDGARLAMWGDLLIRTGENPIAGVGLGTRALDYNGMRIEDHNIFVTHVSRYGIPLFIGWLLLIFLLIRKLRSYILVDKYARIFKLTLTIMYLNFFFQASVGNIWGQVLVTLLIGISIGLLLYKNKELHTTLVNP